jgi:hypothetical protein
LPPLSPHSALRPSGGSGSLLSERAISGDDGSGNNSGNGSGNGSGGNSTGDNESEKVDSVKVMENTCPHFKPETPEAKQQGGAPDANAPGQERDTEAIPSPSDAFVRQLVGLYKLNPVESS